MLVYDKRDVPRYSHPITQSGYLLFFSPIKIHSPSPLNHARGMSDESNCIYGRAISKLFHGLIYIFDYVATIQYDAHVNESAEIAAHGMTKFCYIKQAFQMVSQIFSNKDVNVDVVIIRTDLLILFQQLIYGRFARLVESIQVAHGLVVSVDK